MTPPPDEILLKVAARARQGDAEAMLHLALRALKEGNIAEALHWLPKAADTLPNAAFLLATLHKKSSDSPQHEFWLRKALAQGHPLAAYTLAQHFSAIGNHGEAFALYRKAAAEKTLDAIHALALCHLHGRGTPKDFQKALDLFYEAATHGFAPSQHQMGLFCQDPAQKDLYNPKQAARWFAAAEKGGIK